MQAPPVHAGQLLASPKVDAAAPTAIHAAVVTREQELAPAREDEPEGHTLGALEPRGHTEPAGHVFVVPTTCPALQKKPAGHASCVVDASVLAGQKKPAAHLFVRSAVLPVARHEPAEQGRHEDTVVYAAPPTEYVPEGHGFMLPTA